MSHHNYRIMAQNPAQLFVRRTVAQLYVAQRGFVQYYLFVVLAAPNSAEGTTASDEHSIF